MIITSTKCYLRGLLVLGFILGGCNKLILQREYDPLDKPIACPPEIIRSGENLVTNKKVLRGFVESLSSKNDSISRACSPFFRAMLDKILHNEELQAKEFMSKTSEKEREREFELYCKKNKKTEELKNRLQEIIKSKLKAPATAKFSDVKLGDPINVTEESCSFIFFAHVDSENSFSALLRSLTIVEATYGKNKGLMIDSLLLGN